MCIIIAFRKNNTNDRPVSHWKLSVPFRRLPVFWTIAGLDEPKTVFRRVCRYSSRGHKQPNLTSGNRISIVSSQCCVFCQHEQFFDFFSSSPLDRALRRVRKWRCRIMCHPRLCPASDSTAFILIRLTSAPCIISAHPTGLALHWTVQRALHSTRKAKVAWISSKCLALTMYDHRNVQSKQISSICLQKIVWIFLNLESNWNF